MWGGLATTSTSIRNQFFPLGVCLNSRVPEAQRAFLKDSCLDRNQPTTILDINYNHNSLGYFSVCSANPQNKNRAAKTSRVSAAWGDGKNIPIGVFACNWPSSGAIDRLIRMSRLAALGSTRRAKSTILFGQKKGKEFVKSQVFWTKIQPIFSFIIQYNPVFIPNNCIYIYILGFTVYRFCAQSTTL